MDENLDRHRAERSFDQVWKEMYDHNLAHYNAGHPTNFECPGGDKCRLRKNDESESDK